VGVGVNGIDVYVGVGVGAQKYVKIPLIGVKPVTSSARLDRVSGNVSFCRHAAQVTVNVISRITPLDPAGITSPMTENAAAVT